MAKLIQLTMNLKDGVTKPFQQIQKQTQQTTKGFDVLKGKMKGLQLAFKGLVAGLAVGAVVDFGKELLEAYEVQHKAEQAVNDSLYANMKARGLSQESIDKEVNAYKELASQLQSVGVIGDEVTLSGMAAATQMGLTADEVKNMTPLVQDLAVKQYGLNVNQENFTDLFKQMATMVNMGRMGLQKYGIQVTDADKKAFKAMSTQERYAFIMNKLKTSVAGANKKIAETPTGKLQRINNEIGDIKEQLGQQLGVLLEPMLKPILEIVKYLNGDFQNQLNNVKQFFMDFYEENEQYFAVFADIAKVWISIWDGLKTQLDPILGGLKDAIEGAFRAIMSLIKGDFSGVWDNLKQAVDGACSAILGFVTGMARGVLNAFAEMIGKGEEWRDEQERLREQALKAQNADTWRITKGVGVSEHNALGTSYFKGGLTHINENNRGEIVNLPNGTQIVPHDVAVKQGNGATYNVNVTVQGNVIGNEEYVNDIGNSIVQKLQLSMNNI